MATTQRVQYGIDISANTSQAKQAIADLQRSIQSLQNTAEGDNFLNEKMNKAAAAAKELQLQLAKATNVNTGKLNLSLLNDNLKASGKSAQQLMTSLLEGGRTGQQAFASMANAIAQAEVPLKQTNKLIADFGNTLKNTVKWEISSNLVHGLESAMSGAVSYAKNLNSSLTDIRIVTGQSTEQMAKFAQYANKAAKDLSTSTRSYADAALIYYQQGDSDAMAKKKAELTIKASNASFDSDAKEMSEYLTAVWNSYQVGSDQLEHYIDVMASLGAKTATSLEEIATSMQKVAATANTVGVSMEQMSSIISTVSSVTREAPESIGTSYKTILARMGDLKLGGSDEDGVTLGTVSSQLDKIGVKVLDANNDLRDMGDIIWDLGEKWQTMNTATKSAVAQAVAGKRQYTQLMALFDNWDMYKENLQISANSDGALEQMANTYAESWEAASKRVQASLESIYGKLLDDQGFIKILNITSALLDKVDSLIDGFGGLAGILTKLGSVATVVFGQQMAKGINKNVKNIGLYFSQFSGVGDFKKKFLEGNVKSARQIQAQNDFKEFDNALTESQNKATDPLMKQSISSAQTLLGLKQKLLENEYKLSDAQKQTAQEQIALLGEEQSKLQEILNNEEQAKKDSTSYTNLIKRRLGENDTVGIYNPTWTTNGKNHTENEESSKILYGALGFSFNKKNSSFVGKDLSLSQINHTANYNAGIFESMRQMSSTQSMLDFLNTTTIDDNAKKTITEKIKDVGIAQAKEYLKALSDGAEQVAANIGKEINERAGGQLTQELEEAFLRSQDETNERTSAFQVGEQIKGKTAEIETLLNSVKEKTVDIGQGLVSLGQGAANFADSFQTTTNLFSVMKDDSADLTTKFSSMANAAITLGTVLMSQNPVLIISTIAGAVLGYIHNIKEEAEKAQQELWDKTNKKTTALLEEDGKDDATRNQLLQQYNSLYNTYLKTGEGQDKLCESAKQLAEAYGLVGVNLDIASGKFDSFNTKLAETIKHQIEGRITSLEQQQADAEATVTGYANEIVNGAAQNVQPIEHDYYGGFFNIYKTYLANLDMAYNPSKEGDLTEVNGKSEFTKEEAEEILQNFELSLTDNQGNLSSSFVTKDSKTKYKEVKDRPWQLFSPTHLEPYSEDYYTLSYNAIEQFLKEQADAIEKNKYNTLPPELQADKFNDYKFQGYNLNNLYDEEGKQIFSFDKNGNFEFDTSNPSGMIDSIDAGRKILNSEITNAKKALDDAKLNLSDAERSGLEQYIKNLTDQVDMLNSLSEEINKEGGLAASLENSQALQQRITTLQAQNDLLNSDFILGGNEQTVKFDKFIDFRNALISTLQEGAGSFSELQQYLINDETEAKELVDDNEELLKDASGYFYKIVDGNKIEYLTKYKNAFNQAVEKMAYSQLSIFGSYDTYIQQAEDAADFIRSLPDKYFQGDNIEQQKEELLKSIVELYTDFTNDGVKQISESIYAEIAKEVTRGNITDFSGIKNTSAYRMEQQAEIEQTEKDKYAQIKTLSTKSSAYGTIDSAQEMAKSLREAGLDQDKIDEFIGGTTSSRKSLLEELSDAALEAGKKAANQELSEANDNFDIQRNSFNWMANRYGGTNTAAGIFKDLSIDQEGNILYQGNSLDKADKSVSNYLTRNSSNLASDIAIYQAYTASQIAVNTAQDKVNGYELLNTDKISKVTKHYQTLTNALSGLPETAEEMKELSDATGIETEKLSKMTDTERIEAVSKAINKLKPQLSDFKMSNGDTDFDAYYAALSSWEQTRASATQAAVSSLESSLAIIDKRVEKTQKEIDKQQSIIDDMMNALSGNRALKGGEAWGLSADKRKAFNEADATGRLNIIHESVEENNNKILSNAVLSTMAERQVKSKGNQIVSLINNNPNAGSNTFSIANGNYDKLDEYLVTGSFTDQERALVYQALQNGAINLENKNGTQKSDRDILIELFKNGGYFDQIVTESVSEAQKTIAQNNDNEQDNLLSYIDSLSNPEKVTLSSFNDTQKQQIFGNFSTVDTSKITNSSDIIELQKALDKARDVMDKSGTWNDLDSDTQNTLKDFGVTGLNEVDKASEECANALSGLTTIIQSLVKTWLENANYTYNKDTGEWSNPEGYIDNDVTEMYKNISNNAQDATTNVQTTQEAINQTNLNQMDNQLTALSGLDGKKQGTATWGNQLDKIAKAYAGLEGAPEVIEQLRQGTIGVTEANKKLVTATLKAQTSIVGLTDDQYDQYKQMLRNNEVTIEGYDSLDDYFAEIDKGRKALKDYTKSLDKATEAADKNGNKMIDADELDDFISNLEGKGQEIGNIITNINALTGQDLQQFTNVWDTFAENLNAGMDFSDAFSGAAESLDGASKETVQAIGEILGLTDRQISDLAAACSSHTINAEFLMAMLASIDTSDLEAKLNAISVFAAQAKIPVQGLGSLQTAARYMSGSRGGRGATRTPASSGGGGSKKKKQNKDYKLADDEIDRYHYIEQRLKRTNAELEENDKLKEKAYGSKYLSYLDSEISKLKDLESEYKMYKDEAAGYLASDRARMAELGAQFDVEGNIANYEEMRKAWLDAYNAGVDAWNNSDQEEGAELAFKQVEKQYEEKTKALQKYEESLEKYEEAQNNILEQQNKVAEALLEQIQTKLEYTTELNETDLKLLEHYSKRYEDQLADQGKSMMNILNQAKQYEENLQAVTEAQAALNAQHAAGQLTDAKYQEGLADLIDKSLEYADALEDLKNDIKEVYQNALDLADEELEKHTAKIDAAKEAVQSYIDILGLLGRGENFANLQKYYYGIYENSLQNLKVQKAYLDTLNQQAEYFKGKGTQMTELEKEQYEALQEKIRDVNSEVLSSTQDTLSALQDAYNNAISDIFKKLDDAMGGAEDSVQALADKYGYYQEEQQRYVSTAKELYEVSKLNRSIEQSIEDSTTAASKERLKALQKLIAAQSKANKLTQYDLDMMNLQYQLALAMEELENAKNAKDTVRLTRDDNGNYGYQYTADQDKINNAQQKYEDVLQQINELAANRISELEQSFLNAQQQYLQSAQEIASDMTLTEEQRAEKLANLQKQYAETMKYIQEQYNTAFKDLSVNQEAVSKHYGETLVETTSSTALQVNDQMKSMIDNIDTYIQNLDAAIGTEGAASTAWKNYIGDIAEVAKALTGIDTGNVQANIDALTKALAESMSKYTEESKDTVDEAQKTFNTIANSLKSVNDATEAWNKHAETIERTETAYEKLAETMQKNIKILANGATYSDIFGTPDSNSDNPLSTGTVKVPTISGAEATGGLSSVIEANFTNKVSTSIGEATARALSDSLRTQIEAYIAALNINFDTIGGALKSSSWTIEQNVHIDASFPNVQDHNEIEEAINDLINSATQYANRKGE